MKIIRKLEEKLGAFYDVLVGAAAAIIISIVAFAVFLSLNGCATTNREWSREDTYRQVAVTSLMMVDYFQTMEIARNPDKYHENNPILGEHPSEAEVTAYFLMSYAVTSGISIMLPDNFRPWWQYLIIGVEGGAVANNFSIGLGFGF